MALKPCRECGKEVSTDAKKCPHCGTGYPTPQALAWYVIAVAVSIIITAVLMYYLATGFGGCIEDLLNSTAQ